MVHHYGCYTHTAHILQMVLHWQFYVCTQEHKSHRILPVDWIVCIINNELGGAMRKGPKNPEMLSYQKRMGAHTKHLFHCTCIFLLDILVAQIFST